MQGMSIRAHKIHCFSDPHETGSPLWKGIVIVVIVYYALTLLIHLPDTLAIILVWLPQLHCHIYCIFKWSNDHYISYRDREWKNREEYKMSDADSQVHGYWD